MTLEKAIEHGQEHRKPWWGPGWFDKEDYYVHYGRKCKERRAELAADEQIEEYLDPRPESAPVGCSPKGPAFEGVVLIIEPEVWDSLMAQEE